MGKILKIVGAAGLVFFGLINLSSPYIHPPEIEARAAIVMDAESNEVLFAKNEEEPFAAASMTKMMTEYLVLEAIQKGYLSWEDRVQISGNAVSSEGVFIPVKLGDELTVRDLFIAMAVASANNAAVALAERLSGSEKSFVSLMNSKAEEFGLSNETVFVNATGLQDQATGEESRMAASDVARLAVRLIDDFSEILVVSSLSEYVLAYDGSTIYTTNEMLDGHPSGLAFKGVDGLKTGYTTKAGYCFAGTAKQGERRLISVVMGTNEKQSRFIETKKLFAYGFKDPNIPSLKYHASEVFTRFMP
ncbi:hypothetical protein A8F94_19435 [Bacillus sp. FJAT-27225]|uniref:D-alanyl-D-alanine carboxypeptidase family protein n=1 Tax=Bacillus sp. FJAT-27225 TaxID=1743144 RepID=UPI00080C3225|nr:D-alanyl-D-alanine carboxypeptidase family protein [Bacillus sp. FJAT-27225]OCA83274.1 hypothetical protein A8F94_19435 [Bacillus sp. FJAT-27225]